MVRLRRLLLQPGVAFYNLEDMIRHARRLSEDPWITGSPAESTRAEQRALRARPPAYPAGWVVYGSDGASRRQGTAEASLSSFGRVRYAEGCRRVVASRGAQLGHVTNNVAEYTGLLENLQHASLYPAEQMRFQVDSLLLARQVYCQWRCRAPSLRPLFETALRRLRELRSLPVVRACEVIHVYRDFNVGADAVCNNVLDMVADGIAPDRTGFNVSDNWEPFVAGA